MATYLTPVDQPVNTFDLSPEQQETASLLQRLLGSAIASRYVDFCRLAAGAFALNVSRPMAVHALRELDSMLRHVLAVPMEAKAPEQPESADKLEEARKALEMLGYFDEDAIRRATDGLKPRFSHRRQIRKIVTRLGLDPEGDIAKRWISLSDSFGRAHERSFHRSLEVDDEFRSRYQEPFDTVIRAVAVALEGRYVALMRRVEEIIAMPNRSEAVAAFASEIPGALPLQWHFFREPQYRRLAAPSCAGGIARRADGRTGRGQRQRISATGNGPPEITCNGWRQALTRKSASSSQRRCVRSPSPNTPTSAAMASRSWRCFRRRNWHRWQT